MLTQTRRRARSSDRRNCGAGPSRPSRMPGAGRGTGRNEQRGTLREELPPTGAESSLPDCFDTKGFGPWTGQASDVTMRRRAERCPRARSRLAVLLSIEVSSELDARIFWKGASPARPAGNRLAAPGQPLDRQRGPDGAVAANVPLCGNCTDIYDNTVSIVLPLATAPLLREKDSMEIVLHLADSPKECHYKLDCATMRKALDWALARRDELATERDNQKCASTGCSSRRHAARSLALATTVSSCARLAPLPRRGARRSPRRRRECAVLCVPCPRLLARLGARTRPIPRQPFGAFMLVTCCGCPGGAVRLRRAGIPPLPADADRHVTGGTDAHLT